MASERETWLQCVRHKEMVTERQTERKAARATDRETR